MENVQNCKTLLKDIGLGGKAYQNAIIKRLAIIIEMINCYSSKNTTHIAMYVNQSEYIQHMDNI